MPKIGIGILKYPHKICPRRQPGGRVRRVRQVLIAAAVGRAVTRRTAQAYPPYAGYNSL